MLNERMLSERISVTVADAREGLFVVGLLGQRRIRARLVADRAGVRVCVATSRHRLPAVLRDTAAALDRARLDASSDAADARSGPAA